MIDMRDIQLEYKSSAVFGLAALLLSAVAGIAAGNGVGHVIGRSFVLMLVFAALGYLVVYVIRKYVPEVFEAFKAASPAAGDEGLKELPVEDEVSPAPSAAQNEAPPEGADLEMDKEAEQPPPQKEGFVPFKESDFTTYSSARPEEGKLGKHFFEQKDIRYEPRIMAEAIRTMIARDKE